MQQKETYTSSKSWASFCFSTIRYFSKKNQIHYGGFDLKLFRMNVSMWSLKPSEMGSSLSKSILTNTIDTTYWKHAQSDVIR